MPLVTKDVQSTYHGEKRMCTLKKRAKKASQNNWVTFKGKKKLESMGVGGEIEAERTSAVVLPWTKTRRKKERRKYLIIERISV